ncbi:hypothetical protein [Microbacterium sp. MMO-113]|uniref:hypothetical protein n=1 Tax=Microbacterium sp. MMO-113 TaxID=3081273 RepID=UPI0030168BEC
MRDAKVASEAAWRSVFDPAPGRGRRITAGEWNEPESLAVPDWTGLVDADLLYR